MSTTASAGEKGAGISAVILCRRRLFPLACAHHPILYILDSGDDKRITGYCKRTTGLVHVSTLGGVPEQLCLSTHPSETVSVPMKGRGECGVVHG